MSFEYGDRVYLTDGTAVTYVTNLPSGHVVTFEVFTGEGDEYGPDCGETAMVVAEVFAEPPVAKKHEEIGRLEARIAELKEKVKSVCDEIAAEERSARERRASLAKWDGLQTLEDFIAGRITHLVIFKDYCAFTLTTLEEGIQHYDDYDHYRKQRRKDGLKLLTLFGKSDGSMSWQLNEYRDGSGTNEQVWPFSSHENAVSKCRELWDAEMQRIRADERYSGPNEHWLKAGASLGFEVPPDIAERMRIARAKSANDALQKARDELKKAETDVALLQPS